jgi:hypothetical protein
MTESSFGSSSQVSWYLRFVHKNNIEFEPSLNWILHWTPKECLNLGFFFFLIKIKLIQKKINNKINMNMNIWIQYFFKINILS